VQIETGEAYVVKMSGTPPQAMRFDLKAELGGIAIRIPYPNAGAYTVWANGREIPYTPWDAAAGRHAPLTEAAGCGENRFVGVENFLDFYLTPGCAIEIKPRDAIMTSVRMEWTLEEFYADQGVTRFSDRVAATLGVHRSTVHVVAVYEGSVIVDFWVGAPWDDEEPESTLLALKNDLMGHIVAGTINLGAPILGAVTDGKIIVGTCYENCDEQGGDDEDDLWDDLVNGDGEGGDGDTDEDDAGRPTQEQPISIQVKVTRAQAAADVKGPILVLAVLAVVLVLIVIVIVARMCCSKSAVTKQETVLRKLDTGPQEEQYTVKADDEKSMFAGKREPRRNKMTDQDNYNSNLAADVLYQTKKQHAREEAALVGDQDDGSSRPVTQSREKETAPHSSMAREVDSSEYGSVHTVAERKKQPPL
jgi:biopolymer transport protein ExbD